MTCFAGSKAIDCLMDSKWAEQVDEPIAEFIPYLGSRVIATEFCQRYADLKSSPCGVGYQNPCAHMYYEMRLYSL